MTATLVVAGVSSHVGKTTVLVALARAFRRRGLRVSTCKCGPDYLDPTFHRLASGRPSVSLDPFLMGLDGVRRAHALASVDADLVLIEGMMGLFDGPLPETSDGSTATIASTIGAPILLVVDASGMARTAAAVVRGLVDFEPDVRVASVLFNRVGSDHHTRLLARACGSDRPIFGLGKLPSAAFPSRHLGLRTADPRTDEASIDAFADRIESSVDLDALLAIARSASPPLPPATVEVERSGSRVRIGVASDEALHFLYPENLARLEAARAELVFFSPIRDPLPDVDGLLLGGGYPELYAEAIAANRAFLDGLRRFVDDDGPVLAECGGLMVLTNAIVDASGRRYEMARILDAEVTMASKLVALGYVEVETTSAGILGPPGTRLRGHQFRYSEIGRVGETVGRGFRVRRHRDGSTFDEGFTVRNVVGTYVHAHWASSPEVPKAFVEACRTRRSIAAD